MATTELHRPPFWRAVGITFETVWRNLGACVVLSVAYAVLTAVPNVVFGAFAPEVDPLRMSGAEAFAIVAFAIAALVSFLLGALVVYPPTLGGLSLVGAAGVAKEPVETIGVVRRAIDRALPASGAFILVSLIVAGPPLVVAALGVVVAVGAGSDAALPLLALAGVLLIVPGVYLLVRLSLAVPIVVLEQAGPVEGVRRSWELMRNAFWWALGVYAVIGFVAAAVAGILGTITPTGRTTTPVEFVVATVRNVIAGLVAVSLGGVAVGVVYAAREVPPDESPPPATPADGDPAAAAERPPMTPVPIPLHAFDHMAPPQLDTSRGGTEPWPPRKQNGS